MGGVGQQGASASVCVRRIGTPGLANRLTTGVQPSSRLPACTPASRRAAWLSLRRFLSGRCRVNWRVLFGQQCRQPRPGDIDKMEFVGKGKILGQQALRRMRTGRTRDQRFARRYNRPAARASPSTASQGPCASSATYAPAPRRNSASSRAARKDASPSANRRSCCKPGLPQIKMLAGAGKHDAEQGAGAVLQAQAGRRVDDRRKAQLRDGQRRDGHVEAGGEFAGHALHRRRAQHGAARDGGDLACRLRFVLGDARR